jgi:hypothetical protein
VVAVKNAVFWDVAPCGSCRNRSVRRFLVTDNVRPSSPILVTLIIEALRSSEMSVHIIATHNITEDGIFRVVFLWVALHPH